MSEVKEPAAKKSTGKGRTKPKKSGARKPAQKKSVKSNPIDQALTLVAKKFVKAGGTKLLLKVFPYLLFGYFGNKMAYAYRVTEAPDFFNKLMGSLSNLGPAFENILPSFNLADLLFGAVFGVGMRLVVYFKSKNAKKFRKGEEYGSARWGNAKDIEPYMDLNDPENNVILSVIAGGCGYADHFNIFQLGRDNGGTLLFIVRCYDRHDIAALKLSGKAVCKALDGHRHGLFGAVQIVQIGVLSGGSVGQFSIQNIVTNGKVGFSVLANNCFALAYDIFGKSEAAHFHGLNHVFGDFITCFNFLCYTDNLCFLADGFIE